jgi:hypothetical protein
MINLRALPTIITFSVISMTFAIVAALLPSGTERKEIQDLRIEYGIKSKSFAGLGEENIFDFLQFQLKPTVIEPRGAVVRSRKPSDKKIATIGQSESPSVRSPQEFIVMTEDNTAEVSKLASLVQQEGEIFHKAILFGDIEGCATIKNASTGTNCRGEIYFQKAVIENNSELCDKIENEELRSRCQKYF